MENRTPENKNESLAPEREKQPLGKRVGKWMGWLGRNLWGGLVHNVWLKLLSLLLAILLWNYVISTNTSITRTKVVNDLTGYMTGQTTLNANRLALLDDPTEALSNISVTVDAPQTYYSRVSAENVLVSLDLSSVRTAGTQEVPLRATSSFGRVTDIVPESLTLTFETQDSRSVPINTVISGDAQEDYWYSVTRVNPSFLTVSGAASVVRNIGSATVYADITSRDAPFTQALPYALFDTAGEAVEQEMLNLSSSSVSVSVDVYPTKDLPVSTDLANVVTGQPADGYVVQSVTMQPDMVTVAADAELLDGLTELMIEPVSVEGASQSFTTRAAISQLSGLRNLSSEQVYVNVVVTEASVVGRVKDLSVLVSGKAAGLSVEYSPMSVIVTGPRSDIEQLQKEGVYVSVDLTGLGPGTYEIAPVFDQDRYPNVEFKPEHEKMTVVLTEIGSE
ncbi:MAG: hypothetical protein IJ646_12665 [Clostridia bacterium]|nr:hypothetical protein [Clostridia bacterium]